MGRFCDVRRGAGRGRASFSVVGVRVFSCVLHSKKPLCFRGFTEKSAKHFEDIFFPHRLLGGGWGGVAGPRFLGAGEGDGGLLTGVVDDV